MTNPNSQPQPPRDERQDELIASVIAFAAIGTVLFLGLGRLGAGQIFSAQGLGDGSERVDASGDGDDGALFGFIQGDRDGDDLDEDLVGRGDDGLTREPRIASQDEGDVAVRQQVEPAGDRRLPGVAVAPAIADRTQEPPLAAGEPDVTAAETTAPEAIADSPEPEITQPVEPTAPVSTDDASPLADIDSGYWAAPFIDRLAESGVVAGFDDGTFRPEQPVTRAEFAAQLAQAFPVEPSDGTINYSDVSPDYWAIESIRQVSSNEFMSGYPEGDFRPTDPVSRLEVLISLVSGLSLNQPEAVQDILSAYTDQGQIPGWAAPKIAAATEDKLVVSHPEPSSLNPSRPATRAETAAMIYQALVQQGKSEVVSSEYIVQPD